MFVSRFMTGLRRGKKIRTRVSGVDVITEQVKQILQTADQKLILMVKN